jgi:hypothetical protein
MNQSVLPAARSGSGRGGKKLKGTRNRDVLANPPRTEKQLNEHQSGAGGG